ncbi:MAG TPA: ABC transporter ATP-binding protein [Armatimonadota bacterium]|jgi:phospholipid/cholesterol/gamma-HCH transport system ATP-binding protein
MAERQPVVQIRGLTYAVGGRTILEDIDLDIYEREVFAVMGLSGTGKTTLLRLITGLIRPISGSIRVLGDEITTMNESALNVMREQVGLVFQYGALFDSLTVRENVGFRLYEGTNLPDAEILPIVTEKLRLVGMSGTEDLYPAELSGGMQKRVGIARTLVSNPHVLMYDEPTSGLDPIIAATIDELILRLRDELGVGEIVVSHDVRSVLRMADRMALLYNGHVQAIGTTDDFRTSADPIVRQFMEGNTEGPIQVV